MIGSNQTKLEPLSVYKMANFHEICIFLSALLEPHTGTDYISRVHCQHLGTLKHIYDSHVKVMVHWFEWLSLTCSNYAKLYKIRSEGFLIMPISRVLNKDSLDCSVCNINFVILVKFTTSALLRQTPWKVDLYTRPSFWRLVQLNATILALWICASIMILTFLSSGLSIMRKVKDHKGCLRG